MFLQAKIWFVKTLIRALRFFDSINPFASCYIAIELEGENGDILVFYLGQVEGKELENMYATYITDNPNGAMVFQRWAAIDILPNVKKAYNHKCYIVSSNK